MLRLQFQVSGLGHRASGSGVQVRVQGPGLKPEPEPACEGPTTSSETTVGKTLAATPAMESAGRSLVPAAGAAPREIDGLTPSLVKTRLAKANPNAPPTMPASKAKMTAMAITGPARYPLGRGGGVAYPGAPGV